jgi:hypothetical protein
MTSDRINRYDPTPGGEDGFSESMSLSEDGDYVMYADYIDTCEKLREALKLVLANLVATSSLLVRSENMKCKPSRSVASDTMFRQMLVDYNKAIESGRKTLS